MNAFCELLTNVIPSLIVLEALTCYLKKTTKLGLLGMIMLSIAWLACLPTCLLQRYLGGNVERLLTNEDTHLIDWEPVPGLPSSYRRCTYRNGGGALGGRDYETMEHEFFPFIKNVDDLGSYKFVKLPRPQN